MSQPIKGHDTHTHDGHLWIRIGLLTQTLVEDVEYLLPINWSLTTTLISGCRGETEHVSANKRIGRPSLLTDRPEKHELENVTILLFVKFRQCLLCSCRGEVENVSINQRESRSFLLTDWPQTPNLLKDVSTFVKICSAVSETWKM